MSELDRQQIKAYKEELDMQEQIPLPEQIRRKTREKHHDRKRTLDHQMPTILAFWFGWPLAGR